MSEEELINIYNQKKYDEALKEVEDKEFSEMLNKYKKTVQISFEEYKEKTKEDSKEVFQYMVYKMANDDIKIFESLELKDKLIKLQEQKINKQKEIIDKIKEYIKEEEYQEEGYGTLVIETKKLNELLEEIE